jgi:hypothetical protein
MKTSHRWWISGALAAAVTLAMGAGAVMAQTPPGTATPDASETPQASTTPDASTPEAQITPAQPGDRMRGGAGCGLKGVALTELAEFFGTDEATLRTELQAEGATLGAVAAAHGQSRDALIAFLTQQFQAHLDQKVAAGDLTAEQAADRIAQFAENIDETVDATGGARFGRHSGMRGGIPGDVPGDDVRPTSRSSS